MVAPIFLLMVLGAFLKKIKIFDEEFLIKANSFAFKALFPVLLFNNIYKSKLSSEVNIKLIVFAVVVVFAIIGITLLTVPRLEKDNRNRGVIIQGLYRSNFVLFGVSLSQNLFGSEGLGAVTTLVAIIIPIYNFMAVIILDMYSNDKSDIKENFINIITNPLIVGSVIGILVSVLQIKLPIFVEKTINDVSNMATPLALMALGGEIKVQNIHNNLKYIAVVTTGRLIVIPAAVILAALSFGFRGPELGALFSMVAPSVAVSSYTMAQQYDCNYELAGQLVFVSTMFSPFTIFMFIFVMKTVGLF